MRFGVCYYPEQWPEDRWATDATQMAALGLELVRIGEFAWSVIEPERSRFEWGWLDRAIETLADAGLSVILGTPTATPPIWLTQERPDILSVGPDGTRRAHGSRRHTSPSSSAYREESARIVTALVERYGEHPAIVAWQIDNEPGNHDSARCWSEESQAAFERWLAERYDTIDALNEAWGTVFWSGTYPSFDAVKLPVHTVTEHTPSLELAHRRFASSQAVDALAAQRAIIAAGAPGREIFTNLYLGDVDIDARAVARPTGLGAVDMYPHGLSGPEEVGFVLDLARGTALGKNAGAEARGGRAWIIEQQPGAVNWTGDNPAVPPGQVRLWCWQAALHGIEGLLWFRWRAARAGQEQHHAALLRHDGTPSDAYEEASRFIREVQATPADTLVRPVAKAALVCDYGDAWLLDIVPQTHDSSHRALMVTAHAAARRLGMDVDVVPADADLTGYEVVLAPAMQQATSARMERLEAAVDAGALLVLGPRSLHVDEHAVWVDAPVPPRRDDGRGLGDRSGARVVRAGSSSGWPRRADNRTLVDVSGAIGGQALDAGPWLEALTVDDDAEDVEVLAHGVGGPLNGCVVAARRGGVALIGASSVGVWTALLGQMLATQGTEGTEGAEGAEGADGADRGAADADQGPAIGVDDVEIFERAGRRITLDHAELRLTGVGVGVDDA